MPEDKTYLSNGVQTGSVVKSYLLTGKGEMPGEGTIQVQNSSTASSGLQITQREKMEY